MTTGRRISSLRESRGVLQKDLAKAISVDPVVLNRIEKDKRSARGYEIKAIADYFNVTTDYLLGHSTTSLPENDHRDFLTRRITEDEAELVDGYRKLTFEKKQLVKGVVFQFGDHKPDKITAPVSAKDINGNLQNSGSANIVNVGSGEMQLGM